MDFGGSNASTNKDKSKKRKSAKRKGLVIDIGRGEKDTDSMHFDVILIGLGPEKTAIIGDYKDIAPTIKGLGSYEEVEQVIDVSGAERGPGIIIGVEQVVKLLNLLEKDGWVGMNPEVRRIAEVRRNNLRRMKVHKIEDGQ